MIAVVIASFYRAFVPVGTLGLRLHLFYRAFVPVGTLGLRLRRFYRAFVPAGRGVCGVCVVCPFRAAPLGAVAR